MQRSDAADGTMKSASGHPEAPDVSTNRVATTSKSPAESKRLDRRSFLARCVAATVVGGPALLEILPVDASDEEQSHQPRYGMAVDIENCIGCGRCVEACKAENDVPLEPFFFRTWVERYRVREDGVEVDSPDGGRQGFPNNDDDEGPSQRSFFVPKLCNHCDNAPCVQVCPVGATFTNEDGVVLVDHEYCIGCRYCIQACPYGARYLDPITRTAQKCTFCYHRIKRGLQPACVEVCPTQARIFGDLNKRSSPLPRFFRFQKVQVLKPHLNTAPKVFYSGLDGNVS